MERKYVHDRDHSKPGRRSVHWWIGTVLAVGALVLSLTTVQSDKAVAHNAGCSFPTVTLAQTGPYLQGRGFFRCRHSHEVRWTVVVKTRDLMGNWHFNKKMNRGWFSKGRVRHASWVGRSLYQQKKFAKYSVRTIVLFDPNGGPNVTIRREGHRIFNPR